MVGQGDPGGQDSQGCPGGPGDWVGQGDSGGLGCQCGPGGPGGQAMMICIHKIYGLHGLNHQIIETT